MISERTKRLLYISNQRMPTEKAYGLQISAMCAAFASVGNRVMLLTPFRFNPTMTGDVFSYYGVERNFVWKRLWAPDFYLPGLLDRIAVNVKRLISALILCGYALTRKADIIYSRDEWPIYLLSFFRKNLIVEIHTFSSARKLFYRRFQKAALPVVTISRGLKEELVKLGFSSAQVTVASDGVDIRQFAIAQSKDQCRRELRLPNRALVIGYVGQLRTMGEEKGVGELIQALAKVRQERPEAELMIVGGTAEDIAHYQGIARLHDVGSAVRFMGRQPHAAIPIYLKACDIVAMPFPHTQHYAHYMSPLKLFEYMAAERPIIATDLPSVREVLTEKNALLVPPDDTEAMARGVLQLIAEPDFAAGIARQAHADVQEHTWQCRAECILALL